MKTILKPVGTRRLHISALSKDRADVFTDAGMSRPSLWSWLWLLVFPSMSDERDVRQPLQSEARTHVRAHQDRSKRPGERRRRIPRWISSCTRGWTYRFNFSSVTQDVLRCKAASLYFQRRITLSWQRRQPQLDISKQSSLIRDGVSIKELFYSLATAFQREAKAAT